MPLPKITLERIKADAEKYIDQIHCYVGDMEYEAYIAGATAENSRARNEFERIQKSAIHYANRKDEVEKQRDELKDRAQKLADALKICRYALQICYDVTQHPGNCNSAQDKAIEIAEKALQQWNGNPVITEQQAATLLHPPDDNSPKGMGLPGGDPFAVKKEVRDG